MFIEYLITEELTMLGNGEIYCGVPVLPGLTDELGRWKMAI